MNKAIIIKRPDHEYIMSMHQIDIILEGRKDSDTLNSGPGLSEDNLSIQSESFQELVDLGYIDFYIDYSGPAGRWLLTSSGERLADELPLIML